MFGLALAYGGIAQFAAGIWEFAKGNTFGATAFCSVRRVLGLVLVARPATPTGYKIPAADVAKASGSTCSPGASSPRYMTVAATRVSGAVLAVFVLLTITFLLLGIGDFATPTAITKIGGYARHR